MFLPGRQEALLINRLKVFCPGARHGVRRPISRPSRRTGPLVGLPVTLDINALRAL